jgi:apolipoprotein N-acyltransferase
LIDSSGKILIEIPLNKKSSFITPFKYLKKKSFYVKFGYLFPYLTLIFTFTFFLIRKFFYHRID